MWVAMRSRTGSKQTGRTEGHPKVGKPLVCEVAKDNVISRLPAYFPG